jgi:hypothetical protein
VGNLDAIDTLPNSWLNEINNCLLSHKRPRLMNLRFSFDSSGLSVGGDRIVSEGGAFSEQRELCKRKGRSSYQKTRPFPSFDRVARQQSPTSRAFWRFHSGNQGLVGPETRNRYHANEKTWTKTSSLCSENAASPKSHEVALMAALGNPLVATTYGKLR